MPAGVPYVPIKHDTKSQNPFHSVINDVLCVEKRQRFFDERAATTAAGKPFKAHLT